MEGLFLIIGIVCGFMIGAVLTYATMKLDREGLPGDRNATTDPESALNITPPFPQKVNTRTMWGDD